MDVNEDEREEGDFEEEAGIGLGVVLVGSTDDYVDDDEEEVMIQRDLNEMKMRFFDC